jgi:hypothetical protein
VNRPVRVGDPEPVTLEGMRVLREGEAHARVPREDEPDARVLRLGDPRARVLRDGEPRARVLREGEARARGWGDRVMFSLFEREPE